MSGYVDRLLERIASRIAAQIAGDGDRGRGFGEPDGRDGVPGLAGRSGPAPSSGSGNGSGPGTETSDAGGALRPPPPVVPVGPPPPPPAVAAPAPPPPPLRPAPETLDVLGDPRLAGDLRRARLEPDAAARPYEEVRRELAVGGDDDDRVSDGSAQVSLKVPAQEQLAAQPAEFRRSLHELLLRVGDDPFGAGTALAAGEDARRLLDDGGYWIVYKPLDEGERVVVEALRRRLPHAPATRREV